MTVRQPSLLFGVLNLNKPAGVTSRDVVNVVQRIIRPVKTGHGGTLDPIATGVLLVCVGPATRLVSVLQQAPKTYQAEFRLGQRSNTDDVSGEIEDVPGAHPISTEEISGALKSFCGVIEQTPPIWSAVKVGGRRAYALARQGDDVSLEPRPVWIDGIDIMKYDWPLLSVSIRCGSGTYIRSIARDLGNVLGCGGLMSRLQRTAIGSFRVTNALDPDTLTSEEIISRALIPALDVVGHISRYLCTDNERRIVERGGSFLLDKQRLTKFRLVPDCPEGKTHSAAPPVAIVSACGTQLLAMGEIRRQGRRIQPRSVFVTRE